MPDETPIKADDRPMMIDLAHDADVALGGMTMRAPDGSETGVPPYGTSRPSAGASPQCRIKARSGCSSRAAGRCGPIRGSFAFAASSDWCVTGCTRENGPTASRKRLGCTTSRRSVDASRIERSEPFALAAGQAEGSLSKVRYPSACTWPRATACSSSILPRTWSSVTFRPAPARSLATLRCTSASTGGAALARTIAAA